MSLIVQFKSNTGSLRENGIWDVLCITSPTQVIIEFASLSDVNNAASSDSDLE